MNYLFWDTERIRNTKIYMSAVILTDEKFNVIKEERGIDLSVDVSSRHAPKRKVAELKDESTLFPDFESHANWLMSYLNSAVSVCFGKDDFVSLNDQLKIHNMAELKGSYYDLQMFVHSIKNENLFNLAAVSKYLNVKHNAHDPLSDSYVTMELFKYLKLNYDIEEAKLPIPNKNVILDIEVNGTLIARKK